jgi:hypothetical protein
VAVVVAVVLCLCLTSGEVCYGILQVWYIFEKGVTALMGEH